MPRMTPKVMRLSVFIESLHPGTFDEDIRLTVDAGKTVLAVSPHGSTIRKRHRSGLTVITPVKPSKR